jgi:hypothetical protein
VTPSFDLGLATHYGILTAPTIHSYQSASDSSYVGNIGIANTGGANQPSPPVQWAGTLTGNIDFAGNINITNTNGITGSVNANVAAVNTAFSTITSLSADLGAEPGTSLTLTGSPQTINASSGMLDSSGNRVFTAGSGFAPRAAITIDGAATDYVVINVPSGQLMKLSNAVSLTGGITDDHVLFNVLGTGNEVGGAANGRTFHGVVVALNRKLNVDSVVVDGRLIGGDSADFQTASNFSLTAPPSKVTPQIITTSNPTGTFNVGTTDITVADTAVVSGGFNETGDLVFTLHVGTSTGTAVAGTPITVALHGNDTYMVSVTLSASNPATTYVWTVTYAGDANNYPAQDQGGPDEQFTLRNVVAPGVSANLGFWGFAKGRALIASAQWGGPTGTALGNWLATNWPNLFGNLDVATNHQVTNYYHLLLMKNIGKNVTDATARAALSTALSVYATTTGLGWGSLAQADGFQQGFGGVGLGSTSYDVGTNGAAFGVADNTYVTVDDLLNSLDGQTTVVSAGNPKTLRQWLMYGGSQTLTREAKFVFFDIARIGNVTG